MTVDYPSDRPMTRAESAAYVRQLRGWYRDTYQPTPTKATR